MRQVNLLELMESRRGQMRVTLQTPLELVNVNVWDELQIDEHDLNTEYMALPGQIAYWTAVTARFAQSVEAVTRDYDNWYAPLYDKEFASLESATGRRPNINSTEYMVKIQYKEEYNKRREVLDQAETDLKVVQGIVPALQVKLQALMQLSKAQLTEFNTTEVGYRGPKTDPAQFQQVASRKPASVANKEAADALVRMRTKNK